MATMNLNKIILEITPLLSTNECTTEVEVLDSGSDENTYQITYSISSENKWDALLVKLYITLNIPVLAEKLKTNHDINADEESILTFVKKKHIAIIPHLSLYTNLVTDYDEISKVYYGSRGQINLDRFGI